MMLQKIAPTSWIEATLKGNYIKCIGKQFLSSFQWERKITVYCKNCVLINSVLKYDNCVPKILGTSLKLIFSFEDLFQVPTGKDLLAILQKSLDTPLFLYIFISEPWLNAVRASLTVHTWKFYKMLQSIVRFQFFSE